MNNQSYDLSLDSLINNVNTFTPITVKKMVNERVNLLESCNVKIDKDVYEKIYDSVLSEFEYNLREYCLR